MELEDDIPPLEAAIAVFEMQLLDLTAELHPRKRHKIKKLIEAFAKEVRELKQG